jgi:hypothetical protein
VVSAVRGLALLAAAGFLVGGSCGGGSGGGGDPPVVHVDTPDDRCLALPSQFPPGFDFVPGASGRALAASFTPGIAIPVDVEPVPPRAAAPGPFADLRSAIAADACPGFPIDPAFDGVFALRPDLAVVTASGCEALAFVDPASGALRDLTVATPAGVATETWPSLPAPGTSDLRDAASTRRCVVPPPGAVDSRGAAIPLTAASCDPSQPSFFSSFTSGAALAAGALFVSVSNLGANAGRPDTQFLPGAVLVFDLDAAAVPPRLAPAAESIVFTSGFNPTHVTAYRTPSGRELVLATVTGALGLVPDDPSTPEREAGGSALSPSAVDVIDAASRRLVATIPLGLAGASFDRIAIDPTGRVAVLGSAIARRLFAVDLAPLDALAFPAPGAPPLVLDGTTGPDAVIFDADAPLALPARPNGAPAATCPGYVVGADFDATGTKLYATDFCDGTLAIVGVDFASAPVPVPADRFRVIDSLAIAAPLDASSLGLARAPGAVRVRPGRPGADFRGPDVFFTIGIPEGALCGVRIDSL